MLDIFEWLGIYGWKQQDQELILASVLTGDPLIFIGSHGTAKTQVGRVFAECLNKKFINYDASKSMFDDLLGFPDLEALKRGQVSYIPSNITIWDKEFVFIDEINRSLVEIQNKWLEIIRSRKLMGQDLAVKFVWAAMNPFTYAGAQTLDEALIGRFATFIYPPKVISMSEEDRIKVAQNITADDLPAIDLWTSEELQISRSSVESVSKDNIEIVGAILDGILRSAAKKYFELQSDYSSLPHFLARFCQFVYSESKNKIEIDGRRLGFINRNILAMRAIQLAIKEYAVSVDNEYELSDFSETAEMALKASIPVGISEDSIKHEEAFQYIDNTFTLLKDYFDKDASMDIVNKIYELFTTKDIYKIIDILVSSDLGEFIKHKRWNNILEENSIDATLAAFICLQISILNPDLVPSELIEAFNSKYSNSDFEHLIRLNFETSSYKEDINDLLSNYENNLHLLIKIREVKELVKKPSIRVKDINNCEELIRINYERILSLIQQGK